MAATATRRSTTPALASFADFVTSTTQSYLQTTPRSILSEAVEQTYLLGSLLTPSPLLSRVPWTVEERSMLISSPEGLDGYVTARDELMPRPPEPTLKGDPWSMTFPSSSNVSSTDNTWSATTFTWGLTQ